MTEPDPTATLSPQQHRRLGVDLFNGAWRLMEQENRTPDDDALLLATTFASTYHWHYAEHAPEHVARGEWQISRVYCVLGRGAEALHHARRVLDICQRNGIGDWDLACAYEALARASAVSGDSEEARRWLKLARLATEDIAEDDDRDVVLADLETIPLID